MIGAERDALARIIRRVSPPAHSGFAIMDWEQATERVRDMLSDNDVTGDASARDDVRAYALAIEQAIREDGRFETLSDSTEFDNSLRGAMHVSAYSMRPPHASYIVRLVVGTV